MNEDELVKKLNTHLENKTLEEVLSYFLLNYKNRTTFSSSFAAEDQVISDAILKINPHGKIFTLDTGRLHPETYDVMDATNLKYNIKIDVYFPDYTSIQNLYKTQGINGHFESIEKRKNCCFIRKIEPLQRALNNMDIWITGLRSQQSITREDVPLIQWDDNFKIIKVNPIIKWTQEEVWNYIKDNKVPYNKLHDQGYPSIGCAPCTRAIKDGEDIRAGRWWWENPEHKECGLHKK
jgi:phosphoadenosine phosphosulfate reductase